MMTTTATMATALQATGYNDDGDDDGGGRDNNKVDGGIVPLAQRQGTSKVCSHTDRVI